MIINFTKLGDAYADHDAERTVLRMARTLERNQELNVSTANVIRAAQVLICHARIRPTPEVPDYEPPITPEQADKIQFAFNGKPVETDHFGRIKNPPPGFADFEQRMQSKFQEGVGAHVMGLISKEQQQKYQEFVKTWVEDNLLAVFTEGTEFYFAPKQAGASELDPDAEEVFECKAGPWLNAPDGQIALGVYILPDNMQNMIPANAVACCTFDKTGSRLIPRPLDPKSALREVGVDTKTMFEAGWVAPAKP